MEAFDPPRETSGITMALIVRYIRATAGDAVLTRVLERAGESRSAVELEDETRWSTYEQRIALFRAAAEVMNEPQIGRHIGETALEHGVGTGAKLIIRSLGSPSVVLRNLPKVAPKFSTVSDLSATEVTKTTATVLYRVVEPCRPDRTECDYVIGLLTQIPVLFGQPPARVSHHQCQVDGAPRCLYKVRWRERARRGLLGHRSRVRDLEQQVKGLQESTEVLRSTTVDLVSPDDLDDVLANIAHRAFAAVGAAAYVLGVSTPDGGLTVLTDGMDDATARSFATAYMAETETDLGFPVMAVEIASHRRRYGVIAAMNPSGGDFFEADAQVLEVYARHAAVALDVATALREARDQNQTASVLLDLARALAEAEGTEEVCNRIARAVPLITGGQRCTVFMWKEEDETLIPAAWTGLPAEFEPVMKSLVVRTEDAPQLATTMTGRKPTLRSLDDPELPVYVRAQLEAFQCHTVATVPVWVGDRSVALITAVTEDAGFLLPPDVLFERLRGVADQAERAFENSLLVERQRERSDRLRGQKQILEMVARGADLREILDTVCLTVEEQVPESMCAIFLMDREGQTLQTVSAPNLPGEYTWKVNGLKPGPFAGSAGTSVFREHAVFVEDIETDRLWDDRRDQALEHGIRAAWAMPIFAASSARVLGAFSVYLPRTASPTEHERAFMEMAVQLAAIAIERKELETRLTHQAFHDSLTGLPNRALFADRLQHALDRAHRQDEPIAVLLVDLDNFKSVNDSLGHMAGDELLKVVGDRLKGCLRSADTAARLGGDEFAILLEGSDRRSAMHIADRILESLEEPLLLYGMEIKTSGSIGLAFSEDGHGKMSDLLRNADTAMYAAKDAGRSRYEIFEQRMHSGILKRLELQAELQQAVDRSEIVVHYQPVYRLDPHGMVGVEALVRWRHPTRGLLPPSEFISMAEETGLIVPLGMAALDAVCKQLADWAVGSPDRPPLRAGVNFSARQLQVPTLVEDISDRLERHAIDPQMLLVEITESVLMNDPEEIAEKLSRLRAIGVGIAIDDFGTGYSSLSYLRRFPVNVLKIDKFFVGGIDKGPEEAAYSRAIVRLGHNLNLDVVAEGIETAGEFEALLEMGCDYGQGFLFSQARPPEEISFKLGISEPTTSELN